MRSLIFGGMGMLGQAVVQEARSRGWPALGLSHAQGDVTQGAAVRRWVREFRPQVVFNCAAFTRVDACEEERERAFEVNGAAVGHLVAASQAAGAILVQVSTDYVFDGEASRPYREDDAVAPLSVYGASKRRGEEEALSWERSLVVRASWLFGPGGPNFVATMLQLLAAGRTPLRVVNDQRGRPTYAPFLAAALCDAAARGAAGLLHYGNRPAATWCELACDIAGLVDDRVEVQPVTTAEMPRPAPRPSYSVLDVGRFEALVGRRVAPWRRGLAEYLAHPGVAVPPGIPAQEATR